MPASSIIYVGNDLAELLEDVPATLEFDEDGIAGGSLTYHVKWDAAAQLVLQLNRHPDYDFMKRKSATITRVEACWANVNVKFEGVDPSTNDDDQSARYSVKGSTSAEPIETHPKFADFAGKWDDESTWKNGAEFNKKSEKDPGKFLGFRASTSDEPNKKAGIRSYLEGGMVYTQTKTKGSSGGSIKAELKNIGYIDQPPRVDDFIEVDEGRDWLLITCDVEQAGDGLKITKQWRLSGRGGWDEDIYKKE